MKKRIFMLLFLVFLGYLMFKFAYAQTFDETITISTYYPSPSGHYEEVSVKEGVHFTAINPISGLTCDATKNGKIVYGKRLGTETSNSFSYCDGTNWKPVSEPILPSDLGPCSWAGGYTSHRCNGNVIGPGFEDSDGAKASGICMYYCGVMSGTTCMQLYKQAVAGARFQCTCTDGNPYFINDVINYNNAGTCVD